MTPRQIQGWVAFAMRRKIAERADLMTSLITAFRGKSEKVKEIMKNLMQEAR